jgi:hypothetical protein
LNRPTFLPDPVMSPADKVLSRVKKQPRPDGMLQCPRCGSRDVINIRNGVIVKAGRQAFRGTQIVKDADADRQGRVRPVLETRRNDTDGARRAGAETREVSMASVADRVRHWFARSLRSQSPVHRSQPLDYLPKWKRDATAGERLRELALIADKHPEQFRKWVLVFCEDNDKRFKVRYMSGEETRTSDCFAVLATAQQHIWEETSR